MKTCREDRDMIFVKNRNRQDLFANRYCRMCHGTGKAYANARGAMLRVECPCVVREPEGCRLIERTQEQKRGEVR
jgi:hypothetical protein